MSGVPYGVRHERVGVRPEGTFRALCTLTITREGVSVDYRWSAIDNLTQATLRGMWEHCLTEQVTRDHIYRSSQQLFIPQFEHDLLDRKATGIVTTGFRYPSEDLRIGIPWIPTLLLLCVPVWTKRLLRFINGPHRGIGGDSCEGCGYDLADLAACPECNWQRPKTPVQQAN
ncbi:MAG: hypothetical protein AB8F26_05920 [Phycisphaerales bacterium]